MCDESGNYNGDGDSDGFKSNEKVTEINVMLMIKAVIILTVVMIILVPMLRITFMIMIAIRNNGTKHNCFSHRNIYNFRRCNSYHYYYHHP